MHFLSPLGTKAVKEDQFFKLILTKIKNVNESLILKPEPATHN